MGGAEAEGGRPEAPPRRLTALMWSRIAVITLLLGTEAAVHLNLPGDGPLSRSARAMFPVVGGAYALSLLWALLLRQRPRLGLGQLQIAGDLLTAVATLAVTGGASSDFGFLFLLVILGAATVLPWRQARFAAAASAAAYVVVALIAGSSAALGWLELPAGPSTPAAVARAIGYHLVAMGITALLAGRLSIELQRTSTDLVEKGQRLADLTTLHADVIASLNSGLITVDEEGLVRDLNAAARRLLVLGGTSVGRPIEELWPGLPSTARSGPPSSQEVTLQQPGGEPRVFGLSAAPLLSSSGAPIGRVLSFQDLTELRQAQARAEREARLAGIGRLAAGVAHEIRNPLAAISGSVELLRRSGDRGSGDNRELWEIATRELERLDGLITDLLAYARPRPAEMQPVDLRQLCAEVCQMGRLDGRFGAPAINLSCDGDLETIGDAAQLRQLLWNLLRNAIEAQGPPIEVRAAVGEDGRWLELLVRDHGLGIAEEHRPRLAEPFFTTKRGGTGLGLATVYRIAADHGGTFELRNAPSGGALAQVRLPRRARG